jgi:hypothetical protein
VDELREASRQGVDARLLDVLEPHDHVLRARVRQPGETLGGSFR